MSTTLKVLSAKKVISTHKITQGDVLVLDARKNSNYQIIDDETGFAPQNIITQRKGQDLKIFLEDGDMNEDIIIQDYYTDDQETTNLIVGQHENGNLYAYIPETGEKLDAVSMLSDNAIATQALGGDELSSAFWVFNPWWLLALAPIVGVGLALANRGGKDSGEEPKVADSPSVKTNDNKEIVVEPGQDNIRVKIGYVGTDGQLQPIVITKGENGWVLEQPSELPAGASLDPTTGALTIPENLVKPGTDLITEGTNKFNKPSTESIKQADEPLVKTAEKNAEEEDTIEVEPGKDNVEVQISYLNAQGAIQPITLKKGENNKWSSVGELPAGVELNPETGTVSIPKSQLQDGAKVDAQGKNGQGTFSKSALELANQPVVEQVDDAHIVVKPGENNTQLSISYLKSGSEEAQPITVKKSENGTWEASAELPEGVTVDPSNGNISLPKSALKDGSPIDTTGTLATSSTDNNVGTPNKPDVSQNMADKNIEVTPGSNNDAVFFSFRSVGNNPKWVRTKKDKGTWKAVNEQSNPVELEDGITLDSATGKVTVSKEIIDNDSPMNATGALNNITNNDEAIFAVRPAVDADAKGGVTVTPGENNIELDVNFRNENEVDSEQTVTIVKDLETGKWQATKALPEGVTLDSDTGVISIKPNAVLDESSVEAIGKNAGKFVIDTVAPALADVADKPTIVADKNGGVQVVPGEDNEQVKVTFTDENNNPQNVVVKKNPETGKWQPTEALPEGVSVDPETGIITLKPNAVKDESLVKAEGSNSIADKPTVAEVNTQVDADKDAEELVKQAEKLEAELEKALKEAESDNDVTPEEKAKLENLAKQLEEAKAKADEAVKKLDDDVDTKESLQNRVDALDGVKMPADKPTLVADKNGGVTVTPGKDNETVKVTFTDENNQPQEIVINKDPETGKWQPTAVLPEGVKVDPETGVVTIKPNAVLDETPVKAEGTNNVPKMSQAEVSSNVDADKEAEELVKKAEAAEKALEDALKKALEGDNNVDKAEKKELEALAKQAEEAKQKADEAVKKLANDVDTKDSLQDRVDALDGIKMPADQPTVNAKELGAVEVSPGKDNKELELTFTDEKGKEHTIFVSKNDKGRWVAEDDLPSGVSLNPKTGKITIEPEAVKDGSPVEAVGKNGIGVDTSAEADAKPDEQNAQVKNITTSPNEPAEINETDNNKLTTTVELSNDNGVKGLPIQIVGTGKNPVDPKDFETPVVKYTDPVTKQEKTLPVVNGKVDVPPGVDTIRIEHTAKADQKTEALIETGKIKIGNVEGPQFGVNDTSDKPSADKPTIEPKENGAVEVTPGEDNVRLDVDFTDENGKPQNVVAVKDPITGKWKPEGNLPDGVTIDPKTGKVTLSPEAVKDGTPVDAEGINDRNKVADEELPLAPKDSQEATVEKGSVVTAPQAVDEGVDLVTTVKLSNNNGATLDFAFPVGTAKGQVSKEDFGEPKFSDGVKLENGKLIVPAGVKEFTITIPVKADNTTEGEEKGQFTVGMQVGNEFTINDTSKFADKPAVVADKNGGATVTPGKDNEAVKVTFKDENDKPQEIVVNKDPETGKWQPTADLPEGVSVDPDTGVITIKPNAVKDESPVKAEGTNGLSDKPAVAEAQTKVDADKDAEELVKKAEAAEAELEKALKEAEKDGNITPQEKEKLKELADKAEAAKQKADEAVKDLPKDVDTKDELQNRVDALDGIKMPADNPTVEAKNDGGVVVTPGADNKELEIKFTDENGKEHTIAFTKNDKNRWEAEDDLPNGVTFNPRTGAVTLDPEAVKDGSPVEAVGKNGVGKDGFDDADTKADTAEAGVKPDGVSTEPSPANINETGANNKLTTTVKLTNNNGVKDLPIEIVGTGDNPVDGEDFKAPVVKYTDPATNQEKELPVENGKVTVPAGVDTIRIEHTAVADAKTEPSKETGKVKVGNVAGTEFTLNDTSANDSADKPTIKAEPNGAVTVEPGADNVRLEVPFIDENGKEQVAVAVKDPATGKWKPEGTLPEGVKVAPNGKVTIDPEAVKDGSPVNAEGTNERGKPGNADSVNAGTDTDKATVTDGDIGVVSAPQAVDEGTNIVTKVTLSNNNGATLDFALPAGTTAGQANAADFGTSTFSNGVKLENGKLVVPAGVKEFTITTPVVADNTTEGAEKGQITVGGVKGNEFTINDTSGKPEADKPVIKAEDNGAVTVEPGADNVRLEVPFTDEKGEEQIAVAVKDPVTGKWKPEGTLPEGVKVAPNGKVTIDPEAVKDGSPVNAEGTNAQGKPGDAVPVNAKADTAEAGVKPDGVSTEPSPANINETGANNKLTTTVKLTNNNGVKDLPIEIVGTGDNPVDGEDFKAPVVKYTDPATNQEKELPVENGKVTVPAGVDTIRIEHTAVADAKTEPSKETGKVKVGNVAGTEFTLNDTSDGGAADKPTITAEPNGAVSVEPGADNVRLEVPFTDENGKEQVAVVVKDPATGKWKPEGTLPEGVKVAPNGKVTIEPEAVKDGSPVNAEGTNERGNPGNAEAVNAGVDTNPATVADGGVVSAPQAVDEGANVVTKVTLSNNNGATLDFALPAGTTAGQANAADFGTPTFSHGVKLENGKLVVPAGVKEFEITTPVVADNTTEGAEKGQITVGGVKGNEFTINDTSGKPEADKPVIKAEDNGAVTVEPGEDNTVLEVKFTDESNKPQTVTVKKDPDADKWVAVGDLPADVTLDPETGKVTIAPEAVKDESPVNAKGRNADKKTADATPVNAGVDTDPATVADGGVVSAPQAVDEGANVVTKVTLSNNNGATLDFALPAGTTAGQANAADFGTPTFSHGVKLENGKLVVPAGVKEFEITTPVVADNTTEGAEKGQITVGGVKGNEFTINDTSGKPEADKPVIKAENNGGVTVEPGEDNTVLDVKFTDENDKPQTVTVKKDPDTDKWVVVGEKPENVSVDPETGKVTLGPEAVKDTSPVNATGHNAEKKTADATPVNAGTDTDKATVADGGVVTAPEVNEGADLVTTVTLSNNNGATLDFALPAGTTAGQANAADFGTPTFSHGVKLENGKLVVPAGVKTFTITTPVVADSTTEGDEKGQITVGGVKGNEFTIKDTSGRPDAAQPTIKAEDNGGVTVKPGADNVKLVIPFTDENNEPQTVTIVKGTDGVWKAEGTAPMGVTVAGDGTVTIDPEAVKDGSTVNAKGTNAVNSEADATPAVTKADTAPTTVEDNGVVTTPESVNEGATVKTTVTLSNNNGGTLDFVMPAGTTEGQAGNADFGTPTFTNGVTLENGKLIVPKGVKTFDINVPVVADNTTEGEEKGQFTVGGVKGNEFTINDTSGKPEADKPTIVAKDDGSVEVTPGADNTKLEVPFKDENDQPQTAKVAKDPTTGQWKPEGNLPDGVKVDPATGKVTIDPEAVKDNEPVNAKGTNPEAKTADADAVNAKADSAAPTVAEGGVVSTPEAVDEGKDVVTTVKLTNNNGGTLDFAMPAGTTAGQANGDDFGTPTFSNGVTLVNGKLVVPAGVKEFTITTPVKADNTTEGAEKGKFTVGGVAGNEFTINDTSGKPEADKPTIVAKDDGSVEVTPGADNTKLEVPFKDENDQPQTAKVAKDPTTGQWKPEGTLPEGVTVDPATGKVTIDPEAVKDNEPVNAKGTNPQEKTADADAVNAKADSAAPTVAEGGVVSAPEAVDEGKDVVTTVKLTNNNGGTLDFAMPAGTTAGQANGDDFGTPTFSDGVTLVNGKLVVPAGVKEFTITTPVKADNTTEGAEKGQITVGGVKGNEFTINDTSGKPEADKPTIVAKDDGSVEVTPGADNTKLEVPFKDENDQPQTAKVAKDPTTGQWKPEGNLPDGVKVDPATGKVTIDPEAVKDNEPVNAKGTNPEAKTADADAVNAKADSAAPTVAEGGVVSAPEAVDEGKDIVTTVKLTNNNGGTLDFAMPAGKTAGQANGDDFGTPTFSNGVTLVNGKLVVPAGVKEFTITTPVKADNTTEGAEKGKLTVGGVAGNEFTINDTSGTPNADKPTITPDNNGGVTVVPGNDNVKVVVPFTDENNEPKTATVVKGADNVWKAEGTLPTGVTVDPATGKVTIDPEAVKDGSTVNAKGTNAADKSADAEGKAAGNDTTVPTVVDGGVVTSPLSVDESGTVKTTVTLSNNNGGSLDFAMPAGTTQGQAGNADFGTPTFTNGVTLANGKLVVPKGVKTFDINVPVVADNTTEGAEKGKFTVGGVAGNEFTINDTSRTLAAPTVKLGTDGNAYLLADEISSANKVSVKAELPEGVKVGDTVIFTLPSANKAEDTYRITLNEQQVNSKEAVVPANITQAPAEGGTLTVTAVIQSANGAQSASGTATATRDSRTLSAPTIKLGTGDDAYLTGSEVTGDRVPVKAVLPDNAKVGDTIIFTLPSANKAEDKYRVTLTDQHVNSKEVVVPSNITKAPAEGGTLTVTALIEAQSGNASPTGTATATRDTRTLSAPTVTLGLDDNAILTDNEVAGNKVRVKATLPANAKAGDTIVFSLPSANKENDTWRVKLTDADITAKTVTVDNVAKAPAEGGSLTVSAVIEAESGNNSSSGSATATRESRDLSAPVITLGSDGNAILDASEIAGNKVRVKATLPDNAKAGDTIVFSLPSANKENDTWRVKLTDADITAKSVTVDNIAKAPAEGGTLTVSAVIETPSGNSPSGSATATRDTITPVLSKVELGTDSNLAKLSTNEVLAGNKVRVKAFFDKSTVTEGDVVTIYAQDGTTKLGQKVIDATSLNNGELWIDDVLTAPAEGSSVSVKVQISDIADHKSEMKEATTHRDNTPPSADTVQIEITSVAGDNIVQKAEQKVQTLPVAGRVSNKAGYSNEFTTGENGDVVVLKLDNKEVGRGTLNADGTFSINVSADTLTKATATSVTAEITPRDQFGNVATAPISSSKDYTVEKSKVTIDNYDDDADKNNGQIFSKLLHQTTTWDDTPTVRGTAEPNEKVFIYNGLLGHWSLVGEATANAQGIWELTLPKQKFGRHTYHATSEKLADGELPVLNPRTKTDAQGNQLTINIRKDFSERVDDKDQVTGHVKYGRLLSITGDINGDGFDDVASLSALPGKNLDALKGAVDLPRLTPPSVNLSSQGKKAYHNVAIGDMDGDGKVDFAYTQITRVINDKYNKVGYNSADPAVKILLGKGNVGELVGDGKPAKFGLDKVTGVASAGDVNGDGLSDLIVFGENTSTVVLGKKNLNVAEIGDSDMIKNLEFGVTDVELMSTQASGIGDFNGDGYGDIVTTKGIFFGSKTGLSNSNKLSFGAGIKAVSAGGDINGDGYADALVINESQNAYVLFGGKATTGTINFYANGIGGGNGGYAVSSTKPTYRPTEYSGIAGIGDVNGDGLADFIVTTYGNPISNKDYTGDGQVIADNSYTLAFNPESDVWAGKGTTGSVNLYQEAFVLFGKAGTQAIDLSKVQENNDGIMLPKSTVRGGMNVVGFTDINGDGLGDIVILSHAATNSEKDIEGSIRYVRAGEELQADVNYSVKDAKNGVINGSKYSDFINGDHTDNVIWGNGGHDVVYAGAGNDKIVLNNNNVEALYNSTVLPDSRLSRIGGGSGVDTLAFDNDVTSIDLTQISNSGMGFIKTGIGISRLSNFEHIDLNNQKGGADIARTLKLSSSDVLDINHDIGTYKVANINTATHQLKVTGTANDKVEIANSSTDGWANSGKVALDGKNYNVYTSTNNAQLFIEDGVAISLI